MTDISRPPLTFAFFPKVPTFTLQSNDIADGITLNADQVASGMGHSGLNRSPHLLWRGFPAETKSFAITIHDPDAPTGSGFWHWIVINISPSVNELASGAGEIDGDLLPPGATSMRNDVGSRGYFGAAPPAGDGPHRYVHSVHALDVATLEVTEDSMPAVVGFNLRFHAIARADIVPVYSA